MVVGSEGNEHLKIFLSLCDKIRRMKVRTNAAALLDWYLDEIAV